MTKGSTKAKRDKFIKLMVPVDCVAGMIDAYMKAYPTCKKTTTARVSAYKLLQDPDIVSAIDKLKREREELIKKVQVEQVQLEAKEKIVSEIQIDAALSDIITTKKKRKRKHVVYNRSSKQYEIVSVDEEIRESDIISAADKLYRRKGAYASTSVKHEGGDALIEFLKAVSNTSNQRIPNDNR